MPRPPLSIRSPFTLLLLLILRESPAPSHCIAYYLGEDPRKVSSYLSHLRRMGLAARDEYGIWFLTDKGRALLERYLESYDELVKKIQNVFAFFESVRLTKEIKGNLRKSEEIQGNLSFSWARTVLERAEQLLGRPLSELEKAIITFLADFTAKTGRKYWWPPEPVPLYLALAEELARVSSSNVRPSEVERALRELEAAGLLYITYDERRGVQKVRLDRRVVDGQPRAAALEGPSGASASSARASPYRRSPTPRSPPS